MPISAACKQELFDISCMYRQAELIIDTAWCGGKDRQVGRECLGETVALDLGVTPVRVAFFSRACAATFLDVVILGEQVKPGAISDYNAYKLRKISILKTYSSQIFRPKYPIRFHCEAAHIRVGGITEVIFC